MMNKGSRIAVKRFFSTSSKLHEKVGFVGLGNMGSRMVQHLWKKGNHDLFLFDLSDETVNKLVKDSNGKAQRCSTVEQVAKEANVIISMLPASKHVKDVYAKLIPNAKQGTLFIDASTIDPQSSQQVNKDANAKHLVFLDAPVSGGVGGAEAGTLTFMVGATPDAFEKAKPYLTLMGKNIVHCGDNGMGQVAKICNNLILGISMTAVSEAMLLGTTLGMDAKKLAGIINTSSGRCWSSDTYNPYPGVMENVPASRGYTGGFAAPLMAKDVGLAVEAAKAAKVALPLGQKTQALYNDMSKHASLGNKDFSGMLEYLKQIKE